MGNVHQFSIYYVSLLEGTCSRLQHFDAYTTEVSNTSLLKQEHEGNNYPLGIGYSYTHGKSISSICITIYIYVNIIYIYIYKYVNIFTYIYI